MIGTSTFEYWFIQACIYFLHYIAPLSALYCIIAVFLPGLRIPLPLEIWAAAEALFLLAYYGYVYMLQRDAIHPTPLPPAKRRELFDRCLATVEDPEHYLRQWFRGAPLSDIRHENVKEFFCWAFLNKKDATEEDEEELEAYATKTEKLLGRDLGPGRGPAVPLRVTLDKVQTLFRSLFWYLCVFVVDQITCISLAWHSFRFHRLPLRRFATVFPFRPQAIFSWHKSPAKTLTYWHRPHTSKTRLPLLFIHGIGIGLYPYVNFLAQVNRTDDEDSKDGQIGIIAIEIMPISFRITSATAGKDQMCDEIYEILRRHGWTKVVLMSHSYGSVVSSHLLHSEKTRELVGPIILTDPVSILLHLPDVAYNFTCRKPKRANEHQLYYFGSMDPGVSHTLGRRFFWSENALWKEDIRGRRVTVTLAGKDLIVDTEAVGRYLAKDGSRSQLEGDGWKYQEWTGHGLETVWFEKLDHAQAFDSWRDREVLAKIVRKYSVLKGEGVDGVDGVDGGQPNEG